jgi:L,D-transpeptidase ErfK/SrfK
LRLFSAEPAVWDEEAFARKSFPTFEVRLRNGLPTETVIGTPRTMRIRERDTFLEVARYYDLGFNELVDANPGIDPWVPPPGTTIVLPTQWVLPCCTYEGIVVNIPEMRLYYYLRDGSDTLVVHTYPVGLGRDDRRTPRGKFTVRDKSVNPTWVIPESIRAEHIRERGDTRTVIPGGDPDNPLGKYRLALSIPRYAIHGTNIAWGVGMQVSHGCSRLYPEDIEHLFPLVPVGTKGVYVYQPVKAGRRGGEAWVEVHRDIYRYAPKLAREASSALKRAAPGVPVDSQLVAQTVRELRGMPVRVSKSGEGLRPSPPAGKARRGPHSPLADARPRAARAEIDSAPNF